MGKAMTESTRSTEILLPPKPTEPLDSECCGTGCTPCVFDIYKGQLKRWEKDCQDVLLNKRVGETDLTSKFLTPEKYQSLKISEIIQDTEWIKIYRFSIELSNFFVIREDDFLIKVGQHVLIRHENICRQFTVLRVDIDKMQFDILIKIYPKGLLTQFLDQKNINDIVEMRGPFGNPFLYKGNCFKQIVMLVAGTGIAPMYRIIEKILNDDDEETRIKLMFASKTIREIPLIKKLKEWSSHWNFEVMYYVSSQEQTDIQLPYYGMKLNSQRIDLDAIGDQTKCCDKSKTLFLICGTKSFEKDMINSLQKLGVMAPNTVVL